MMRKTLAIAALPVALGVAPATGRTGDGPSGFAGHWRVAGVAVSDDGVQALTNDDPA